MDAYSLNSNGEGVDGGQGGGGKVLDGLQRLYGEKVKEEFLLLIHAHDLKT